MKLLVAGSRNWDLVSIQYHWMENWTKHMPVITLFEGGAQGCDAIARQYALQRGWEIYTFLPKYDLYGSKATHIRNQAMVDQKPDLALIFWRDKSPGTKSTITKAFQAGITTRVCYYEDYV